MEPPVEHKRTSVGLDVHARSVVVCGLDGQTGELFERRLTPDHDELLKWLAGLSGPVQVAYEAGPTGFGLARALTGREIVCRVAAPSRLQRPSEDRPPRCPAPGPAATPRRDRRGRGPECGPGGRAGCGPGA